MISDLIWRFVWYNMSALAFLKVALSTVTWYLVSEFPANRNAHINAKLIDSNMF